MNTTTILRKVASRCTLGIFLQVLQLFEETRDLLLYFGEHALFVRRLRARNSGTTEDLRTACNCQGDLERVGLHSGGPTLRTTNN